MVIWGLIHGMRPQYWLHMDAQFQFYSQILKLKSAIFLVRYLLLIRDAVSSRRGISYLFFGEEPIGFRHKPLFQEFISQTDKQEKPAIRRRKRNRILRTDRVKPKRYSLFKFRRPQNRTTRWGDGATPSARRSSKSSKMTPLKGDRAWLEKWC